MNETICFGCMEKYTGSNICPYCGYDQNSKVKESYYLEPGNILKAKYLVGQVLGYGGFGITYMGMDLSLERKVAIKEYMPSDCATRALGETKVVPHEGDAKIQYEAQLRRFIEEAQALAKFEHEKGIVNVYDFFLENNTGYIVMEYMSCPTLNDILNERHRLPYEEAVDIISQVLSSLKTVHAAGIIHRDVAPDNIFLTEDGRAKLTDFGAARYVSVAHSRSLSVILKPGYAPIEQYSGRGEQSSWTDVYAAAGTLYRMITGRRPPDAPQRLLALKEKKKDILPRPSDLGIDIPVGLENALMNGLHVQKEDRYKTAEEFLAAIKREEEEEKPVTIPVDKRYKKIKILTAVISVAFLAVGVCIACLVILGRKIKPPVAPDQVYLTSVVGMSYDEATKELKDCTLKIVGKSFSNSVPYDCVVQQIPEAGSILKKGSQVELIMSGGEQEITMPSFISMTEEEALHDAAAYGLEIREEQIQKDYNDLVEKGRVFDQSVSEGTKVDPGKTDLKLSISLGRLEDETKILTVPDLVGKTKEESDQILLDLKEQEGFTYPYGEISYENSVDVPKGQIMKQNLMAGTQVRTSESIALVISDGPRMIIMPNLMEMSSDEAKKELESLGLKAKTVMKNSSSVQKGLVFEQSIQAGQEVAEGSTISLKVSNGPKRTTEQQAQSDSEREAQEAEAARQASEAARKAAEAARKAADTIKNEAGGSISIDFGVSDIQ